jgi:hypothetical protein
LEGEGANARTFHAKAHDAIRNHVQAWVLCYVRQQVFDTANQTHQVAETLSSPYAIAGRACISLVDRWNRAQGTPDQVRYVFEEGGPDKGGLVSALDVPYKLSAPSFDPSSDIVEKSGSIRKGIVPLQAADLLAYELRKHKRELILRSGRLPRKSLRGLLKIRNIAMASFLGHNTVTVCGLEHPIKYR